MTMELSSKNRCFIRIFKEEFKRELEFLWNVLHGRSAARADFTDGIINLLKQGTSKIAGLCPLPAGIIVDATLGLALDFWNESRKTEATEAKLEQILVLDEVALDIVLDAVALEITCRYEYFINQRLEEGVLSIVSLVQAAIARMLSHIASRKLAITETNLLQGLIAGLSGAGAGGYLNTELLVKLETKTAKQFLTRRTGYTAEGLFGRSGFLTPDELLWALPDKRQAYHCMHPVKALVEQTKETVKSNDYGYSHFSGKDQDPKYLAYVSDTERIRWYGHLAELQPHSPSQSLLDRLQAHKGQQQLVRIDRVMLEAFLKEHQKNLDISLVEYVRSLGFSSVTFVLFSPAKKTDYDLTQLKLEGIDFSNCVFNHCHFGGSLNGARFEGSHLRQAVLKKVISAQNIDFRKAHLEYLIAPDIHFHNTDFTQAYLLYADLTRARLTNCKIVGTFWGEANLRDITTEDHGKLLGEQKKQITQLKTQQAALKIQQEISGPVIEDCRRALKVLQSQLGDNHQLVTLQCELLQEQQQRAAADRWYQEELSGLKRTMSAESTAMQKALETQQTLMTTQTEELSNFRSRIDSLSQKITSMVSTDASSEYSDLFRELESHFDDLIIHQREDALVLQRRIEQLELQMNKVTQQVAIHNMQLEEHKAQLIDLTHAKKTVEENEKHILDCSAQFIREIYLAKQEIRGLFGAPLRMEGQYINVQILYQIQATQEKPDKMFERPEDEESKKTEIPKAFQDARMSSFEDLFSLKMPVNLTQLFTPAKTFLKRNQKTNEKNANQSPRFLLIQGRAGIGKTTFVEFAAREWAAGRLWPEYPWVFVLRCRDLRNTSFVQACETKKTFALSEWVYHALYAANMKEIDFKTLWDKRIAPQLDQCLFILDGYDELPDVHPCRDAVKHLLASNIPKIVTSRPYGLDSLPQDRRDLEIMGFVDENVERYVRYYYGEPRQEQANNILSALRANTFLWGSAHIPVTLNIICGVLEEKSRTETGLRTELEILSSMSGLYQRMENALLERAYRDEVLTAHTELRFLSSSEKEEILTVHYQQERQVLMRLAFKGFSRQQLVLSPELVREVLEEEKIELKHRSLLIHKMLLIGFLKPVSGENPIDQIGYEFLHLTFQEYYTAFWIASILKRNDLEEMKILNQLTKDPRYQIVWWFVSGALKTDSPTWLRLIALLQDSWKQDLIGDYTLGLLVRCTEEAWELAENTGILSPLRATIQQCLFEWFQLFQNGLILEDFNSPLLYALRMSPRWLQAKHPSEDVLTRLLDLTIYKLDDDDWQNPFDVLLTFLRILKFPLPPTILDHFTKLLQDEDKHTLRMTLKKISILGPVAATPIILDNLLRLLLDNNSGVIEEAITVIESMGASAATPGILNRLMDLLCSNRHPIDASSAIGKMGASAATSAVLACLGKLLNDTDFYVISTEVGGEEIRSKKYASEQRYDYRAALADALDKRIGDNKIAALYAIVKMGSLAATPIILSKLDSLLKSRSEVGGNILDYYQHRVSDVPWYKRTEDEKRIYGIFESSKTNEIEACKIALEAIGEMGAPAAGPCILSRLCSLLNRSDSGLVFSAAVTIGKLGAAATPYVLDDLLHALHSKDKEVRNGAARAIEGLGSLAATPAIVDRLMELLQDHLTDEVCDNFSTLVRAIGNLGASAIPTLPDRLLMLLRSDASFHFCFGIGHAIGNLCASGIAPVILDRLTEALFDESEKIYITALYAMTKLDLSSMAPTPMILDRLIDLLTHPDWGVREFAAEIIGIVGVSAASPDSLDYLDDLLSDDSELVGGLLSEDQETCTQAINIIGKLRRLAAKPIILKNLMDVICHDRPGIIDAMNIIPEIVSKETIAFVTDRLATVFYRERYCPEVHISLLHKIGADSATLPVLDGLLHLFPDNRDDDPSMPLISEIHSIQYPLQRFCIELLTANTLSIVHPVVFIAAYLGGNIQLIVQWEEETQRYVLQGFHDKTRIYIPLNLQETQILRHVIPRVIEHTRKIDFESIKKFLGSYKLPTAEKDPLLPEYRATLHRDSILTTVSNPTGFFVQTGVIATAGRAATPEIGEVEVRIRRKGCCVIS